jgi:hypothetical protein
MDLHPAPAADYSLRRYLVEAFEVVTNADSRLLRTFRALVAQPGTLTAAYFSEERDRYLRPQQVLLFCSVFYFFAQPLLGFNVLSSPLEIHLTNGGFRGWVEAQVLAEVARRGSGLEAYRAVFDAAVDGHARTLAVVMVPLFALLAAALFWKPRRFLVEHLVFATHFIAFLLLTFPAMVLVLRPAMRGVHVLGVPPGSLNTVGESIFALAWGVYLVFAVRRTYGHGWGMAVAKGFALMAGFPLVLMVYRLVLFLATFHGL